MEMLLDQAVWHTDITRPINPKKSFFKIKPGSKIGLSRLKLRATFNY